MDNPDWQRHTSSYHNIKVSGGIGQLRLISPLVHTILVTFQICIESYSAELYDKPFSPNYAQTDK